jgi:hypothetical protein
MIRPLPAARPRPSGARMASRLALLCALLFAPLVAHASTSNCAGIGDGTACTTQCISAGFCHSNACVATTTRPDGSACSSEDKCTVGDSCLAGQCVPGSAITCPGQDACNVGACVPSVGCVVIDKCKPDLSAPLVDMATSVDQGPQDLATVITDACFMPPQSEFLICPGVDGPVKVPVDLSGDDLTGFFGDGGASDLAERYGHLRGSRPGDCDVAPGARTTSPLALGLLACALLLLRRLRGLRT